MQPTPVLLFEPFELNIVDERLWLGTEPVPLTAKAFAVLRYLAEHPQRLLTRNELFDAVWPQTYVSDGALTACIRELRRALQDSAQAPRYIETVRGRGYRFVVEVTRRPHEFTADTVDAPKAAQGSLSASSFASPDGGDAESLRSTPETSAAPPRLSPVADRRQLTVLFCDLAGSTALSEQLDPEDLHEVLGHYHAACVKVIERFGGHVAQYLGDGLLIYFGYPHAYEDGARRAVYTGLGILRAMVELNRHLESSYRLSLVTRIGIHTGLVVMGDVGAGSRVEQLAVGIVPNLAARLQAIAASDTLLVSAATYELIEGYFVCQALGEQTLSGLSQPISVYRVLRESSAQTRLDVAAVKGLTPLVGRAREVELLLDRWAQVRGGMGQVVTLSGEAGIGKSRLVQILGKHIADEPHLRLECRSSPYDQHTALYPITQLFLRALNWQPEDTSREKLDKLEAVLSQYDLPVPELVPIFANLLSLSLPDDRYPPTEFSPHQQRHKMMEAFLLLLLEQAAQQPVLLIVEDLHWSDVSTIEFLTLLIDQVPTTTLYALLTYRPSFQPPWGSRSYLTQLTLNRLSHDDVAQMVTWNAGGKHLLHEVMQHVSGAADGVPLFIEEMTKAILQANLLRERQDHYELSGPLPPVTIPATLHDSLMARVDQLGLAKEVWQLGAVIGRQFTYEVVKTISPWDDQILQRELGCLVSAELLYQRGVIPRATYLFKHSLIQEIAYQSLLKSTRQRYHLQIAQTLSNKYTDDQQDKIFAIAHHLVQAGSMADTSQVVKYTRQAGDYALASFAWGEGTYYYTAAIAAADDVPTQHRAELHYLAGISAYWDGNMGLCLEHYDHAVAAYQAAGDISGLAQALIERTYLTVAGRYGTLADLQPLEEVLETLGQDEAKLRGRIMTSLSELYWMARKTDQSAAMAQRALEIGQRLRDDQLCARASFDLAMAYSQHVRVQEALESFQQTRDYARQAGSLWLEGWPLQRMPIVLFLLGRFDEVEATASEAKVVASQTNNLGHYSLTVSTLTCMAVARGEVEAAERYAQETMETVSRYGFPFGSALALPAMASAYARRGAWTEAKEALDQLMEPGRVFDDPEPAFGPIVHVYRQLIQIYMVTSQGQPVQLPANFRSSIGKDHFDVTSLAPCCALVEIAAAAAVPSLAEPACHMLLHAVDRGVVFSRGWIFLIPRILGVAATLKQRWDKAEDYFQLAIRTATHVGARPELGLTYLDYARMLVHRDGMNSNGRAIELLHQSHSILQTLGMDPFAQEVVQLIESIQGHTSII